MNDSQTIKYTVAARFIPRIQSLLEKVSKRCRRLRIAEPVLTITGSETRTVVKRVPDPMAQSGDLARYKEIVLEAIFNHVELTGPAQPKLAGWEFAGTLEHDLDTNLTILRTSGAFGRELPKHFRTVKPVCDHCHTIRARKDTYVVYHAANDTYRQVGSNCIKDFLGLQNVDQAISIVAMWQDIEAILDGDYEAQDDGWREWSNAPKAERVCDLWLFLNRVASVTRVHGFVSRKAVMAQMEREDTMSDEEASRQVRLEATRDRVMDHLFPPRKMSNALRQDIIDCEETPADNAKALAAVEWVKSQDPDKLNDYMFNLFAAVANDVMPLRRGGIVASLIGAYNRHMEYEDERQRKAAVAAKALEGKVANCKHVGTVGERLRGLTLKVVRVIPREGQYGVTYITALEDLDGNQFTWFASGTSLDVGVTYTVTGTVKSQGEFRGVPQTVLTRCKAEVQETPDTGKSARTEAAELPASPAKAPRDSFMSHPDPEPRKTHEDAPRIVLTPAPVSPEQQYVTTALQATSLVLKSGNLAGGYLEYNPDLWAKIYAK
jgi:hypothetical protein